MRLQPGLENKSPNTAVFSALLVTFNTSRLRGRWVGSADGREGSATACQKGACLGSQSSGSTTFPSKLMEPFVQPNIIYQFWEGFSLIFNVLSQHPFKYHLACLEYLPDTLYFLNGPLYFVPEQLRGARGSHHLLDGHTGWFNNPVSTSSPTDTIVSRASLQLEGG